MASSKSKTSSTTTTDMGPWKVQQPYLQDTFSEAQRLYNENKGTPGYQGDFYAGMSDGQKNVLQQGTDFMTGEGTGLGRYMMGVGQGSLGAGTAGMGNAAAGLSNIGTGQLGGDLASAGLFGLANGYNPANRSARGLYSMATGPMASENNADMLSYLSQGPYAGENAASGLAGMAYGDSAGGNINNAQRYAAGLDLDGLTDAATYGARRQTAEETLPSMYRANAATGNLNSDRAALAEGVVQRGLAENAQNIRSQLGADAYKMGLGFAQNDQAQSAQNLANAGQLFNAGSNLRQAGLTSAADINNAAAGLRQAGFTSSADIYNAINQLKAQNFTNAGSLSNSSNALRADALSNSGNLYGQLGQLGLSAAGQGYNTVGQSINSAADYGAGLQGDRQAQLDAEQQRVAYDEGRPFDLLNRYYGLVGANQWGKSGTESTVSTTKNTPSGLQIAGGVLSSVGSLFGGGGMFGKYGAFGGR